MMKIRTTRLKNADLIELSGRMDAASKDILQDAGDRILLTNSKHIAVDLTGLAYISSAGIGALVRLASLLRDRGGVVSLCGAVGVVKAVIDITRVATVFRICDTVAEAVASESPEK